jgi:hypothetical protein
VPATNLGRREFQQIRTSRGRSRILHLNIGWAFLVTYAVFDVRI